MSSTRSKPSSKSSSPDKQPRQRRPSTDLETLHVDKANIDIKVGDHVEFKHRVTAENPSTGVVESIITDKIHVGKRHFNASEDEPKVVIRNAKTNKRTAYDPDRIIGITVATNGSSSS